MSRRGRPWSHAFDFDAKYIVYEHFAAIAASFLHIDETLRLCIPNFKKT